MPKGMQRSKRSAQRSRSRTRHDFSVLGQLGTPFGSDVSTVSTVSSALRRQVCGITGLRRGTHSGFGLWFGFAQCMRRRRGAARAAGRREAVAQRRKGRTPHLPTPPRGALFVLVVSLW